MIPPENGRHFDVVICQNSDEILSILRPVDSRELARVTRYRDAGLSERELEVQLMRDQGLSRKAICERLFISLSTLKTHLHRIQEKLASITR